MFIKIHRLKDYVKGNTQSCADLVKYLEKENKGLDTLEKEYFFNQDVDHAIPEMVIQSIDFNTKGLKKDEARFFMVMVNPSQFELRHLGKLASGRNIEKLSDMTRDESRRYLELFKTYTQNVMNEYAHAFNRNIERKDLLYYVKVEQRREYKGYDKAVKNGQAKVGELKKGLQTHAHIIVSRRDKKMEKSLSPLANSRGVSDKHQLNGKNVQVGFDRKHFMNECEHLFDRQFNYDRKQGERFLERLKYTKVIDHYALKAFIKAAKIVKNIAWELEI